MGVIRMGPPEYLLEGIAAEFKIGVFIETGTYRGETAVWASRRFPRVVTLENFRPTYDETRARYGHIANIEFSFGHSTAVLPGLVQQLDQEALFWLDAHWMGEGSYGESDECPLVSELRILNQSGHTHFICIDDARLFQSPPPLPHRIEQWPTIGEILAELGKKDRYTLIDEDVIVSVPARAKDFVARLVQERTTARWRSGGAAGPAQSNAAGSLKTALRRLFR